MVSKAIGIISRILVLLKIAIITNVLMAVIMGTSSRVGKGLNPKVLIKIISQGIEIYGINKRFFHLIFLLSFLNDSIIFCITIIIPVSIKI